MKYDKITPKKKNENLHKTFSKDKVQVLSQF